MTSQTVYSEDEIDVRQILNSLFRRKWWILGITLLFAVAGLLIAKLLIPKTYSATSYIVITKPSLTANLDSSIVSAPELPDARSLTDLTKADDLVLSVYKEVGDPTSGSGPVSLASFKGQLNPTLVGINQLQLNATDLDPERAAEIANVWAEKAAARLNLLFGSDIDSLGKLEEQKEQARQNWDESEQALLAFLPNSQSDVLNVNVTQAREVLKTLVLEIQDIDSLISDLNAFQYRLSTQNTNETLSLADRLSLISLQQQAVGQFEGLQVQITSPDIQSEGYTVAQARASMDALMQSLQDQREELISNKLAHEATITELGSQLEEAQYNIAQLSVQRDLDLKAYEALSAHLEELQITLTQNDKAVKMAGSALPPTNPSGPRALIVAVAAGVIGFALAVFLVLVVSWWKSADLSES
jgi:uncharacterized protein involved in exopolysaccharide biosynthesis